MPTAIILRILTAFEEIEDRDKALEELTMLLKAWDNKYKGKVKYFVDQE